ncbi:bifunctional histidinal dehydrogenase/ histidinol dehydrogenase [Raoultella planticola]|uniref:Bifunctional histidinal dehydrogenase/ histidinol dehydrogenase n=1 Tax=Raoultella planticola TaxID=575 RepID=A0A485D115_RAOPL|nr:bifunctional histidinal dehydrogenase/ histidinol dehydrogenase [Raoultella planticola]
MRFFTRPSFAGVRTIFNVGGAQAIAALAFGTRVGGQSR